MPEPDSGFVSSVFDQTFRRHPYLFLFVVICCGMVLGYSYQVFAEEIDVDRRFKDIGSRIEVLERRVDQGFLEHKAYSIEAEIYDLERTVAEGKATRRDHARVAQLRVQLSNITRRLDALAVAGRRSGSR